MDTGMLHTHVLVVVIFMLLFLVKAVLLVVKKQELLAKVRAKTKIAEMILGALILITGIYLLWIQGQYESWLIIKVVIVLIAIPLGIAGFIKNNVVLVLLSLFAFIYVYGVAETKSIKFKKSIQHLNLKAGQNDTSSENMASKILSSNENVAIANAKAIYDQLCLNCHGTDGKLGKFKASDLSKSTMSNHEKKQIIANGKGVMKGYRKELSDSEIESIALYLDTFKK
ncbi:MAG: hypothetical protein FVQ77_06040 [Cytophagales bacterium]|nr:hypothetical protein [Cytophagales bacterium]